MSTVLHAPLPRAVRRRLRFGRVTRNWLFAWLGGPVIGIANGVARELLYADRLGDGAAHQVSTASAVALFALYFAFLDRRWPLPTLRTALAVGAAWLALTVAFEFGFGHYVDGKTWAELLADYDLAAGRLWPLLLLWLAVGPAFVRAVRLRRR